ncbi:hypothetical protein [Acinetobacter sp. MB5]|uniref:hypothetical protein n=1 Tax=Acinetobacter sp. MB5 TaxID=2069438 RepID=UPI000DCF7AE0|nr:hypothetical protein [Acinetobacter sp. MB5]
MVTITKDDVGLITRSIAIGFTPAGLALDIADLARASYNLYRNRTDDNYFEVILCIIGFIPGAGDGIKTGLRIVNRRPELLFEVIRFVMVQCKVYGDPEKWLDSIINVQKIRQLIQKAKQEALNASNKNIDSQWAKYWVNQSIELSFNFIDSMVSRLVELLLRKILHWKTKVPKTSAQIHNHSGANNKTQGNSAHSTTYGNNAAKDGHAKGGKGRSLSRSDITQILTKLAVGGVGEHMADYWVADKLGIKVNHDAGQQPTQKIQRVMTKLYVGVHDIGIDAIWKSDKKNIGMMNTRTYAIIEAKASLSIRSKTPNSLLNDLNKQHDDYYRRKERDNARKEKRQPKRKTPEKKTMLYQQMSNQWVESKLPGAQKNLIIRSGYSRHLIYYDFSNSETLTHFNTLALSLKNSQPIDHKEHLNEHTPTNFWGSAKIDEVLNERVTRANKKNGYTK